MIKQDIEFKPYFEISDLQVEMEKKKVCCLFCVATKVLLEKTSINITYKPFHGTFLLLVKLWEC